MLLRALAERISKVTYDSLPAEAVAMAKQGILDTVGVTLAGAKDETTAVVARALRTTAAPGPALIFGSERACRRAQCRADQRRRLARARFRRLQQYARRPSFGADPAGAVGDRARARAARLSSPPMPPGSNARRGSPAR